MNVTFRFLQGTGNAQEMMLEIYNPAHGVGGAHEESKKTAIRIAQPAENDTMEDRHFTETIVLMTKAQARAVASALMGAASEL
jgi:hypothetical protein